MLKNQVRRLGNSNINVFLVIVIIGLGLTILWFVFKEKTPPPINDNRENKSGASKETVTNVKSEDPEKTKEIKPKITPAPKIENNQIIAESLPPGSIFEVKRKSGFITKGKDKDWESPNDLVFIGVYFESIYKREIEKNDGDTLVELRTIVENRAIKVLSSKSKFQFALEKPIEVYLEKIDLNVKETLIPINEDKNQLTNIFTDSNILQKDGTAFFKFASRLEGKKIRITSVQGKGVIAVEPVDCKLNASERQAFFNKDPMALFSTVLKTDIKQNEKTIIPGFMFREALELVEEDPIPSISGFVVVDRLENATENQGNLARFQIRKKESSLSLKEEDQDIKVFMKIIPEGTINYSLEDKCVREMIITGDFEISAKPKTKALEKSVILEPPILKMTYSCIKKNNGEK